MTERRDIGSRLSNWARWVHDEAGKPAPINERRQLDIHDAKLVEASMLGLNNFNRLLLWWCYIDQGTIQAVCQKLRISSMPATHFIDAFDAAQQAIAEAILRESLPLES